MRVPVAGAVIGDAERRAMLRVVEEMRITAGPRHMAFERDIAEFLGARWARLVNSGSSANLAAISALCSPKLAPMNLKSGDEVITVACAFPTTVAPIVQNGLVPVFVDVVAPNYNVDIDQLKGAITPRTKAVVLAHTLGAPFDVRAVEAICKKHHLWLVEDNCDALGSTYSGRLTGTFGHLSTLSFYPAHHITTGEGGVVVIPDSSSAADLVKIVTSLREWGRDCWCAPGCDNTCGRRFDHQQGTLPEGYDHKYTYSHLGYNLKMTEMQAAIGQAQLERAPDFIARRRSAWGFYRNAFADLQDDLMLPEVPLHTDPSWFGFLITMRDPRRRNEIVQKLESAGVQTRMLFAGNLLCHPAMKDVRYKIRSDVHGYLPVTDQAMLGAFWIGVYPGITNEMREYVVDVLRKAVKS